MMGAAVIACLTDVGTFLYHCESTVGLSPEVVVVVGSRQPPNQPGSWQVDVGVGVVGDVAEGKILVALIVVVGSLQPNQPGVLQVVVVVVVVEMLVVVVVVDVLVVVLSKQPHHPGVSQVDVLVAEVDVEVVVVVVVVVISDPLLL